MKTTVRTAALSLALLASSIGPAFAADTFTDVQNSPAKDQIEALHAKNIVQGVTDDQFAPEQPIKASEGITMIVKGLQLSASAPKGADSAATPWYEGAFASARANGIDLPAEADPAEALTKEQFVHFVMQALEKSGRFPMINLVPVPIADQDQMTVEYQGTIQRALHYKLVSLDEKDGFHPKSKLTRAEAAIILYQAVQLYEKQLNPQQPSAATDTDASGAQRWMNVPEGVTPAANE